MPRSPLAARLPEIRSPAGRLCENIDLISRQRMAKLASPSGSVHTACRWVGQNDHGVDRERMLPPHLSNRVAQFVDVFGQQVQPSFCQIDGEEEATSGNEVATVASHAVMLAW